MANRKIIEFPELTDATNDDVLLIVDVSDLTESDEGTTKKIKKSNLSATVPLATSLVTGTVKTDITETDPIVYTKTTVDDLLDNVVHKTGDETIYGIKNFEDEITTDFGIEFRGIGAGIAYNQGEYNSNIKSKTLTTNRVIDFPDKDGVIALDVDLSLKANADGTILYHSVKWFTPSSTVSNVGATVTSVGTQFTSGMVGAKLIINGEQRIITAFTSSTVVTVASAYSTNYVGVVAGSWGVYSIMLYYDNANNVRLLRVNGGDTSLTVDRLVYTHLQGAVMMVTTDYNGILIGRDYRMAWSTNTNATTGAVADIAIRRNTAGTLEVFNGVTADGTLTNRRDLLVRNLLSNKALIGTTTDNGVDALQVNGTVSGSPATLSSQFVTKGQTDLIRPYKVYSALISQTGTDAPTVIVLENSIGSIVWTRTSLGLYTGTLTGAFTVDKTMCFITPPNTITAFTMIQNTVNTVIISTQDDSVLIKSSIEIRVYN